MNSGPIAHSVGPTSTSLVRRLGQADSEAWLRLVDLYGPLVYSWLRAGGLQAADAADVFQEVFASVATSVARFRRERPEDTFRGWLWTVTRNKIRDHYRACSQRTAPAGGTDAWQRLGQIPDQWPEGSEVDIATAQSRALFHRALEAVRAEFEDRTWQAFWRVTIEQEPARDVAADLGITTNGVRQAKSRVLRRLREELGDL